jgi:23S rRNA (cytidine1920-2'-O)/16S rRNA (cytidine1409-2'-O)-methyltransferase
LDLALVERGLAPTREKAQRLIMAGEVRLNGHPCAKASLSVTEQDRIECSSVDRYVGRGGLKLDAALAHFQIHPIGWHCLDIGASTGGFTDCLLQHGAARVVALDVGHGQLDWKIRSDPRVDVREKVNARNLTPSDFTAPFDLVVTDVSFISLRLILPPAFALLKNRGDLCALIKPQFEAGKKEIGKGGIVREESVRNRVVADLQQWAQSFPVEDRGVIPSPITGTEGNHEFLWVLRKDGS